MLPTILPQMIINATFVLWVQRLTIRLTLGDCNSLVTKTSNCWMKPKKEDIKMSRVLDSRGIIQFNKTSLNMWTLCSDWQSDRKLPVYLCARGAENGNKRCLHTCSLAPLVQNEAENKHGCIYSWSAAR